MNYKPKISKIKHKLMAAFIAAISLFCISISASAVAWFDPGNLGGGGGGNWTESNPPFSHISGIDQIAWHVDLYVSKNADGKINEASDTIGNKLALVGSGYCVSSTYGAAAEGTTGKTYLQTDFTNNRQDIDMKGSSIGTDAEGNFGVITYTLPTLLEFNPLDGIYTSYTPNGTPQTVAIAKAGDINLFNGQYSATTGINFTDISTKLTGKDAGKYTSEIIKQLMTPSKGGEAFLKNLLLSIDQQIYDTIIERAGGTLTLDYVKKYLLPDSSDCMVEWALVITPFYRFKCNEPFYCYKYIENGRTATGDYVALDAYWMAQYDRTTVQMRKDGKLYQGLIARGDGSGYYNIVTSTIGALSNCLLNNSGMPASLAYCGKTNVDCYLGIYTHAILDQNGWYSLLKSSPSEYAKRGGIAVFTTKIKDSPAPVYYHTYTYRIDENDKDSLPSGYTPGTYSTDDPGLLKFLNELDAPTVTVTKGTLPEGNTFSPKKGAEDLELNGLVVAAVSPQPTLNPQPGSQDEYPILSTTDKYLERVLDSTEAQLNPTNPLADTATLKTGKATPDNTADDPKEFHVHVDNKPKIAEDT